MALLDYPTPVVGDFSRQIGDLGATLDAIADRKLKERQLQLEAERQRLQDEQQRRVMEYKAAKEKTRAEEEARKIGREGFGKSQEALTAQNPQLAMATAGTYGAEFRPYRQELETVPEDIDLPDMSAADAERAAALLAPTGGEETEQQRVQREAREEEIRGAREAEQAALAREDEVRAAAERNLAVQEKQGGYIYKHPAMPELFMSDVSAAKARLAKGTQKFAAFEGAYGPLALELDKRFPKSEPGTRAMEAARAKATSGEAEKPGDLEQAYADMYKQITGEDLRIQDILMGKMRINISREAAKERGEKADTGEKFKISDRAAARESQALKFHGYQNGMEELKRASTLSLQVQQKGAAIDAATAAGFARLLQGPGVLSKDDFENFWKKIGSLPDRWEDVFSKTAWGTMGDARRKTVTEALQWAATRAKDKITEYVVPALREALSEDIFQGTEFYGGEHSIRKFAPWAAKPKEEGPKKSVIDEMREAGLIAPTVQKKGKKR